MSKRTTTHSINERYEIVEKVINERESIYSLAKREGIDSSTIKGWLRSYRAKGIEGLKESIEWNTYSDKLKRQAVEHYLNTPESLEATCDRYTISSSSVLRRWIKLYTSGKGFKSTSRGSRHMNKGRKTTWAERIEITQFTIANGLNYHKAEERYNVSYQQVYQWVRKYQAGGPEALKDRRGRTLESKETLTDEEKLQLEVKRLKQRNEYLEAENGLIKKLKAIERRDRHV
ncbi:transposase [Alkalibacterium pelagium]|uniref:Transposase and inactivated derivatives n=4 Tax=Alkalibacterium pelagium TaxID=426702 RepID=A0A1H7PXJ7_9LACT|nr:transposase [Alkalibacterium pelagium]SEL40453.1 Transposase and inactivated derivatives [Alkalibacterium pelagium]